jgi:hypothetical protein
MFDNFIEGYAIKDDDGKIVGYECDFDKALKVVDKQIATIQSYAKAHQQAQTEQPKPTGPALDMKTSSGAIPNGGDDKPPASLAEAMMRLQDEQLAKLRKN